MRPPYDEERSKRLWSKIKLEEHGFRRDKESIIRWHYGAGGSIPPGPLYDYLKGSAIDHRDREGVIDTFLGLEPEKRRRKTYQQLYDDVNTIILNLLELGVDAGDKVCVQLPNIMESWMVHYAATKIGAIFGLMHLALPAAWTKEGLEEFLIDPKIYIIAPSFLPERTLEVFLEFKRNAPSLEHIFVVTRPDEPVPKGTEPFSRLLDRNVWEKYSLKDIDELKPDPCDPTLLLSTGATTGFPKLPSSSTILPYTVSHDWAEKVRVTCYDNVLLFGPLSGTTVWAAGLTAHRRGAVLFMLPEYSDEAACKITEEEKITLWGGYTPLMISAYSSPYFQKYDISTLRGMFYAGAFIPSAIRYKLWDMGIKTFSGFGAVSAGVVTLTGDQITNKKVMCETDGTLMRGGEFKIIDEEGKPISSGVGETGMRGSVFGAWRNPKYNEETIDDEGWNWDGDWGRLDEFGNYTYLGRPENLIEKSAQIISALELENVLYYYPKIAQATVIGMPDPEVGQRVCLIAIPKEGETLSLEGIHEHLKEYNIDEFKWPERLEVVDKFPLAAGGKINYAFLSKWITEKLEAEGKI